jgi:putative oxidoreductase
MRAPVGGGTVLLSGGGGFLLGISFVTKNPVYFFFYTPGNAGLLVLRLAVAGIFFFHGTQKAFGWFGGPGWQGTIERFASPEGFGLPAVLTMLVIVLEVAVCPSLFFGFLTRLSGLAVVAVMSGAMLALGRTATGFASVEFPFILWACGFALLCAGGGALSVDRAISKNLLPVVG